MADTKIVLMVNKYSNTFSTIFPVEISAEDLIKKPEYKNGIIFKRRNLPTEDDFRDAWKLSDDRKIVYVDFDIAKELTKTRLRIERKPLLAELDIAFQRALETGDDTTIIVFEKNRLRNITSVVDTTKTLEELRNIKC